MAKNDERKMGVTHVDSTGLLETARIGVDLPRKRGDTFRGAYIVSDCGRFYLGKDGFWTLGISQDEKHWWKTEGHAKSHLLDVVRKIISNVTDDLQETGEK